MLKYIWAEVGDWLNHNSCILMDPLVFRGCFCGPLKIFSWPSLDILVIKYTKSVPSRATHETQTVALQTAGKRLVGGARRLRCTATLDGRSDPVYRGN